MIILWYIYYIKIMWYIYYIIKVWYIWYLIIGETKEPYEML